MSETPIKKQALLIGINQYQNLTELKYARQDAEAVADALKQNYCFSDDEIILLTDAKRGRLFPSTKGVIQWHLDDLIQQNHEFDLFIFGFWGHGLYRGGQRYLCPQAVMDEDVCELGLSFDALQKQIVNVQAKNTCMIFDCCQTIDARGEAQPLTDADQTIMENAARDIVLNKNKLKPGFLSNVAILNSCSKGQSAYEWDERKHGIFTAHLLDAMNRRIDSVSSLISYVGNHVKQTALELGKDQKPYYTRSGDADFPLPVSDSDAPPVTGDVFISYRHCNADLVKPVVEELKRRGITYFVDWKDIDYGEQYSEVISQSIFACKILLLFWTSEVKGSKDIVKEIKLADRRGKSIIPYKIGDFDADHHDKIIYDLVPLSWYEVSQQTPETIARLVDKIESMLSGRAPKPTVDNTSLKPESPKTKLGRKNLLKELLEQEENEKRERIDLLQIEAASDYKNKVYEKAIPKLEEILKLDSSLTEAQELLARCKTKIEERKRREEEAKKHDLSIPGDKAGERKTVTVNDVEFAFRWCPAGTFMMGSPTSEDGRDDREIQHRVTLTKGFWMMETEVTQKQWKAVMGNNPSKFKGDDLPVEQVSWNDCQEFCKKCAQLGLPVHLPTEAQWEYACRAGSTTAYFWGNALNGDKANCDGNYPCGTTTKGKYLEKTTPVGSYEANAWGLYDMHGNVWEWCADWYGEYPSGSVTDQTGPSSGSPRVNRGGGWSSLAGYCRSAYRGGCSPGSRYVNLGFRVVRGQ